MTNLNFHQRNEIAKIAKYVLPVRKPMQLLIQPKITIERQTITLKPKNKNKKQQKIIKSDLQHFLNTKPKPKWNQKLEMIKKYNPSLIINYQQSQKNNKQKKSNKNTKIIIHKKTIKLIIDFSICNNQQSNKKVTQKKYIDYENSLVKYLRSDGFEKKKLYSKDKLLFQRYQKRHQKGNIINKIKLE
ncbi:hypothetical protein M0813_23992 [Anaeramoeba flamelloides]|uniref:Uncharacterized protein n=1 Tax=Anaeramoeba flamelloides TaxID=1746091 RepID=A0ABQ8Y7W1_9EUKA|nr:hypothetical protein M0813_23992 [Anaeramoeba flamelloides]